LRQARGEAVRRDTLDRNLGEADKDLAAAAVMTAGDSGAAMIAELTGLTEYQVQRLPTDRVDSCWPWRVCWWVWACRFGEFETDRASDLRGRSQRGESAANKLSAPQREGERKRNQGRWNMLDGFRQMSSFAKIAIACLLVVDGLILFVFGIANEFSERSFKFGVVEVTDQKK
jgi:hypothetical protein